MKQAKTHRVAVVGCGALAQHAHLPNTVANPRLKLVATCDVDPQVAAECAQKFGAQRHETDWRRIVEADDIDLIILATHINLRGELIIPALKAGKPVYTEKPLSASREEMVAIIRTVRETGVPVCVGHNRRSSPAVQELVRLIKKARTSTEVVRPSVDRSPDRRPIAEQGQTQILIRINDDVRSWKDWIFWDEEGIMFAEMVHFIDLALLFHNSPPVKVYAEGSARGNFVMTLRYADGSIANFHHTLVGNFDYPKELFEVTLNQVSLAMEQHIEVRQCGLPDEPLVRTFPFEPASAQWVEGEGVSAYYAGLEKEHAAAAAEGRPLRWINVIKGHADQLDRFVTHLEGGGANPCDVESSVPVNRLALKFLESVRLGLPVAVGPEDWDLPG